MRDDAAMIDSPDKWPCYPLLAMKHRDGNGGWPDKFGVMLAIEPYTVYEGSMSGPIADLLQAPKHVFTSAAAVVAAGWIVD